MKSLFAILPRYISRNFLTHFIFLLLLLLFVVYLFDLVELLRRAGDHGVDFSAVSILALFKLPEVGQIILPFVVLFSAMYTFWRLNHTHELAVMRSIGLSAVQFSFPLIFVAFCLGCFTTVAINPVSSLLLSRYEVMENKLFQESSSLVSISKSGLWLRQNAGTNGYALLNAARLNSKNWTLQNVLVFEFNHNNILQRRIQAETGRLENGKWIFDEVKIFTDLPRPRTYDTIEFPTELTSQDIVDTFSSFKNVSFWKVPEFIKTLRETGFSTERLEVYYQSLIARPFFFAAMILLAAAVSLRPSRQGGTVILVLSGVFIGFVIFFTDSVLQAFGISQKIPVFLAAWTPTIVSILLGGSVLLQLEDG